MMLAAIAEGRHSPRGRWNSIAVSRALALAGIALAVSGCASTRAPSATRTADRAPVVMSAKDAEHFRAGMRAYLEAAQGIVDGLAAGKMPQVAESARKAGMESVGDVSVTLVARMPAEFTLLAGDTHQKFDALAAAAASRASRKEILEQFGAILANCSACHSMYRVALAGKQD